MRLLTDEQHNYLVQIVEGRTTNEMAEMINSKFGLDIIPKQLQYYKKNHNLKSNISTTFRKGSTPVNKGTKGLYNVGGNRTSFKPGQRPKNYKPVGYERVDRDGYVLVKVHGDGPWQKRWRHKHKILWEEANGSIPSGHKLLFADQNKQNITLENLILVSNKQMAVLNKKSLLQNDAELTKTGIILADMHMKIAERKKKK